MRTTESMIVRVLEVAHHRNGMSGAPFYAVRFTHKDDAGAQRTMLATVFPEKGAVAVLATDRLDTDGVAFSANSWRGDNFERELRAAVEGYEAGRA